MSKIPKDIKARLQSIDPSQSFFIEADAGSGKTEQLSRRILSLLTTVTKPEQILPITFTKKAASEMGTRVMKYLKMGMSDKPPKESHLVETWELAKQAVKQNDEMGWDLINNPNRLQIMTIDSFCLNLLNNHPVANKYGAAITPIEDARRIYLKAAEQFLEGADDSPVRDKFVSYCGNNTERAASYLSSLMGNRDQWLPLMMRPDFINKLNLNFNTLVHKEADKLYSLFNEKAYLQITDLLQLIQRNLLRDYPSKKHMLLESHLGDISFLPPAITLKLFCNIIISADKKSLKKRFDKRSGLDASCKVEKGVLEKIIDELRPHFDLVVSVANLPMNDISSGDEEALLLIKNALIETYAHLKVLFKYTNSMDFIEITSQALDLTDPDVLNEALLHVDNKYQHLLIDEFQDTSSAHHRLLANLVSGWEIQDGRTVFLVGDPKQSLYLFRSAALGLYIDAKHNGVGDVQINNLQFSVNFRSYKSIVDWVNSVFEPSFPAEDDSNMGAAKYGHSEPFSDKELGDSINYFIGEATQDTERNGKYEAEMVVDQVQKLHETVPHETVAILIRSRSHLKYIDKELRDRGLNYKGIDLVKLSERQPIIDLINLTKFVLDSEDTLSLLGLLRAPFVGVLQKDIFKILAYVDEQETTLLDAVRNVDLIEAVSADGKQRLEYFFDTYDETRKLYLTISFRYLLESLWRNLDGDSFTEDLQDGDILSFFSLITSIEKHKTIKDIDEFEYALNRLYVEPNPDAIDNIVVMTIHKSKGLEFDNVLIPGMHRRSTNSDSHLISWVELELDGNPEFLMACRPAHGLEQSDHLTYVKDICRKKEVLEMARLLYVACTRAVKRLYLFAMLNNADNIYLKPSSTALMSFIYDAIFSQLKDYNKNEIEDFKYTCNEDKEELLLTRYKINE